MKEGDSKGGRGREGLMEEYGVGREGGKRGEREYGKSWREGNGPGRGAKQLSPTLTPHHGRPSQLPAAAITGRRPAALRLGRGLCFVCARCGGSLCQGSHKRFCAYS